MSDKISFVEFAIDLVAVCLIFGLAVFGWIATP